MPVTCTSLLSPYPANMPCILTSVAGQATEIRGLVDRGSIVDRQSSVSGVALMFFISFKEAIAIRCNAG